MFAMNKLRSKLLVITILLGLGLFGHNASAQDLPDFPLELPPELLKLKESVEASQPKVTRSKVEGRKGPGGTSFILDVLDLKDMDVLDVLKLISQKSGLNIVAGQNVKGRVTVFLKDIKVMEALEIIVEAYGWAYAKDGEIIKVMTAGDFEIKYGHKFGQVTETNIKHLRYVATSDLVAILTQLKSEAGKVIADEKSSTLILIDEPFRLEEMDKIIERMDVPIETKVFHLSYAKVEEISNKITEVLTPGVGTMKFDDRSNRIVISDTSLRMEEIVKLIDAFDQKDEEVHIEAKIIQVTLNDDYKLGIDWDYVKKVEMAGNFNILPVDDSTRGDIKVGMLTGENYNVLIEALEEIGVTEVLSSPRIAVVNNKEAKILVGTTKPYVTSSTTTPASGPTTTAETVNFIEVGVKLFVTPTIHKDGFITMKIKPEVSSAAEDITTGNQNKIPIVVTTEAETTVLVKDGVTIVIGGLIEEEKTTNTSKIPLFGDIPFLGYLFKNTDDSISKREIVIFLTPRIITGDVPDETIETGLL